jgi:hypothetical protein
MQVSRDLHIVSLVFIKKITVTKLNKISKICKRTKFQAITLSGASVDPTSEIHTAAMFVLLVVGNKKC